MNRAHRMCVACVGAAVVAAAAASSPVADAQNSPVAATNPDQVTCVYEGQPTVPPDVSIFDKPVGGTVIGRFTGATTALRISDFAVAGAGGRARVRTGTGTGSFRLDGYAEISRLPFFTTRALVVTPNHLWIAAQREVRVVGPQPGANEVELSLNEPMRQSFRALAPCGSLSLTGSTPPGWDVPGDARGYVVADDQVELYDRPGPDRALVTVLNLANGLLLWSREAQGDLVHVEYHGAVVFDAWARRRHLRPLPPGETQDAAAPPLRQRGTPQLRIVDVPREVTPRREIVLRSGATDSAPAIGVIEPNTPTYVLDVVAGWASVLPKSLHVAPPDQGQFWASAADLGLRRPPSAPLRPAPSAKGRAPAPSAPRPAPSTPPARRR
jgi:hypothetical protein